MGLDLDQPTLASRALGVLYVAGAGILMLTIVLPARRHGTQLALLGIFALASAVATLLLTLPSRITLAQCHLLVALGTALVTLCVYFSRVSTSPLAVFYVWVATYSAYFFRRSEFIAHMVWVGLAYAAVLALQHQSRDSIVRWVATIAIAAVTGALVSWLVGELRRRAVHTVEVIEAANRELDERVRARTAELAAANSELEAFCYSVSHDLRAPLRAIDGFSSNLLRRHGQALDDDARELLERVRAETGRMAELIEQLLMLSRLTTHQELLREHVDLTVAADEIAAELAARAPERSVTWRIERALLAEGDPELLRTVIRNLLENAWKFTAGTAQARVEFGRADTNGASVYMVRDNGVGFDMEHREKLFKPFERLHRRDEFPGNGVGLTTVQRIIRRHGGDVWADAAPGAGATFYFDLKRPEL